MSEDDREEIIRSVMGISKDFVSTIEDAEAILDKIEMNDIPSHLIRQYSFK